MGGKDGSRLGPLKLLSMGPNTCLRLRVRLPAPIGFTGCATDLHK
jgi:hypothetical protein